MILERDTVIQTLTKCRRIRGRHGNDLQCLLPLLGYLELHQCHLPIQRFRPVCAHPAEELAIIRCITAPALVSPETTSHWGIMILVLWTADRWSHCLFLPAKTKRTSYFKLGDIQTSRSFAMESTELIALLARDHGADVIESDAVTVVAYLPN